MRPTVAVLTVLVAAATACGSSSDPVTVDTTPTSTPTTTVGGAVDTTPAHDSTATVVIGEQTWEFAATCALPGEDEVIVWGTGEDPETGRPAELLLEASASAPYVGISAGGRLLEAAIDGPLVLTVDAGTVTGEAIEFVADADIDTGQGTPVGEGSVLVACQSYAAGPTLDG